MLRRKFWPYDEVNLVADPESESRVTIVSPWLQFKVEIADPDVEAVRDLINKFEKQTLSAEDLNAVSWFFSSLARMPLAYILPRAEDFGMDLHQVIPEKSQIDFESPLSVYELILEKSGSPFKYSIENLPKAWSWDLDATLQFSKSETGFDPESLFSVARRFHLLNDLEHNKTAELLAFVAKLKKNSDQFRKASAIIIRQNHYITELCDSTLRAALPISQGSHEEVLEFIDSEYGHDKLLLKALVALDTSPALIAPIGSVVALMSIFKFVAERNLLGFAMIVDIFERTSYGGEDPMTGLLKEGGEDVASQQMGIHREINDSGEHENVALTFLESMKAVDENYARQALRFAELATLIVHQISAETLSILKTSNI